MEFSFRASSPSGDWPISAQNELKYYFRSNRFTSVFCHDSNRSSNARYFKKSTFFFRDSVKYVPSKSHVCASRVGKTIFLGVSSFGAFATSCVRRTSRKKPCTPVTLQYTVFRLCVFPDDNFRSTRVSGRFFGIFTIFIHSASAGFRSETDID